MNKWIRWALLALAACIVSYFLQSLFGTTRLMSVIAGMGFFFLLWDRPLSNRTSGVFLERPLR